MIDEKLIKSICATIGNGNRVNRILPLGGKIVMDQALPFICVYRYKTAPDLIFTQLIRTQASYLIVNETVPVKPLLSCLASLAASRFNAFLIIELWQDPDQHSKEFQILCPEKKAPATIKSLVEGLDELKDIYPSLETAVVDIYQRHPGHLEPLLSIDESKELGCLLIGIRIPPVYEDTDTGLPYSLFLRKFKRRFSKVIKKAVFEFVRIQASKEFSNYMMLGKTTLDNLVRFADLQLANLSERMNFLMRITPVNSVQEWDNFKKNNFEKKPSFNYRLIPLDPEIEKRKIYKLHIERIEDPILAYIFRDKRLELEKQLTMLEERETRNFRFLGESLYGGVERETIQVAETLLQSLENSEENSPLLNCHDFASEAQKEIDAYKETFPDIDLQIQIRKDVSGVMVSKCHLLVSHQFLISADRVEALIQHEVGTHILSYCNGHRQPLRQMYAGFAGYEQLQEGLAVLAEYLTGGLTAERMKLLAGRVLAVSTMTSGAEFVETFRVLKDQYGFDPKTAYYTTMRVFRGGGFTKDALYLAGLIHLLKYLQDGGNLELLYCGKFHLKHVPVVKDLLQRRILKDPYLGAYLKTAKSRKRLEKLNNMKNLTELLNA